MTVPRTKLEKIQWFQTRLADWSLNPGAIGLTVEQVTNLSDLVDAAESSTSAASVAKQAALDATRLQNHDLQAMQHLGSQLVQTIRAYAKTTDDPTAVYNAASVEPKAPRKPKPVPTAPNAIKFELRTDGAVVLKLQDTLTSGLVYVVQRQATASDGSTSEWQTIATHGGRMFVDASLPLGTIAASYQVKAVRGTMESPWSDAFTARLQAQASQANGLKLAA